MTFTILETFFFGKKLNKYSEIAISFNIINVYCVLKTLKIILFTAIFFSIYV